MCVCVCVHLKITRNDMWKMPSSVLCYYVSLKFLDTIRAIILKVSTVERLVQDRL